MWIPFLFVSFLFMPESPWYLVRKDKYAEAERVVCSLMSNDEREHARPLVASMIHTNNLEQEIAQGVQYWDCFRGIDLRRTEIACVSFIGQITSGAQFAYSATYFFQQAGLSSKDSYKLNLGGLAWGSWLLFFSSLEVSQLTQRAHQLNGLNRFFASFGYSHTLSPLALWAGLSQQKSHPHV